jgi:hypothetical protein
MKRKPKENRKKTERKPKEIIGLQGIPDKGRDREEDTEPWHH